MSESFRDILKEELQPLRDEIKSTKDLLTGNGTPEKGIIVRVDRIEQTGKNQKYWFRAIALLAISAFLSSIRGVFK